jgi:hypothetical protein
MLGTKNKTKTNKIEIIEALHGPEHESTEMHDDERKQPNQEDSPLQVKLLETDSECANIPAEDTTIPMDIDKNGCKETESDKVKIQYTYKSSKDFIPALPLSGKPHSWFGNNEKLALIYLINSAS